MIRLFSGTSRSTRRRSKSVDRLDPKQGSRRKTIDGSNIDPLEKLRNVKAEVRTIVIWGRSRKNVRIHL